MAGKEYLGEEHIDDQDQNRDILESVRSEAAEEAVNRAFVALEETHKMTGVEKKPDGVPEDIREVIEKDNALKDEMIGLKQKLIDAKGVVDDALKQEILLFADKVIRRIDVVDKNQKSKLKARIPSAYNPSTQLVQEIGENHEYLNGYRDAGETNAVLDAILTSEGLPDVIRMRVPGDDEREAREAEELAEKTALDEQQRIENQKKQREQTREKNNEAKSNIDDLHAETNPYIRISGTPAELLKKLHKNPERLTSDERLKVLQYILVSRHFNTERNELTTALLADDVKEGAINSVRNSIRRTLRGGIIIDLRNDTKKNAKKTRNIFKKPFQKAKKSFDIADEEEEEDTGEQNSEESQEEVVHSQHELLVPENVTDEEINKALFTLPQIQACISLRAMDPFKLAFEHSERHVKDMTGVSLSSVNLNTDKNQRRAAFVGPNQNSPYAQGYRVLLNTNTNVLLNDAGILPIVDDLTGIYKGMGFTGFVEGDANASEQPYSRYVAGVLERVAARFVLLGNMGAPSYNNFVTAIKNSTHYHLLLPKGYSFPSFKDMQQRVIGMPEFLQSPFEAMGTGNIKQQRELLKKHAAGDITDNSTDKTQGNSKTGIQDNHLNYQQNSVVVEEGDEDGFQDTEGAQKTIIIGGGKPDSRFGGTEVTPGLADQPRDNDPFVQGVPGKAVFDKDGRVVIGGVFPKNPSPDQPKNPNPEPKPEDPKQKEGADNTDPVIPDGQPKKTPEKPSGPESIQDEEARIPDYTKLNNEEKAELAKSIYLGTTNDYVNLAETPLKQGKYDTITIVFSGFPQTPRAEAEVNGFNNELEQSGLWQMKQAARGKRAGIFYMNIGTNPAPVTVALARSLQQRRGLLEANPVDKTQAKPRPRYPMVVTLGNKNVTTPIHKHEESTAGIVPVIKSFVDRQKAGAKPMPRERVTPDASSKVETGGSRGWKGVLETAVDTSVHLTEVTSREGLQDQQSLLTDGQKMLVLVGTEASPVSLELRQKLTSYFGKRGAEVCYISNGDNPERAGKYVGAVVMKKKNASGGFTTTTFNSSMKEQKIKEGRTYLHDVSAPFAFIVHRQIKPPLSPGQEPLIKYPGNDYDKMASPTEMAKDKDRALKFTVNALDAALQKK